jgi:hypothetical protein
MPTFIAGGSIFPFKTFLTVWRFIGFRSNHEFTCISFFDARASHLRVKGATAQSCRQYGGEQKISRRQCYFRDGCLTSQKWRNGSGRLVVRVEMA